jgi:hypothetical protein
LKLLKTQKNYETSSALFSPLEHFCFFISFARIFASFSASFCNFFSSFFASFSAFCRSFSSFFLLSFEGAELTVFWAVDDEDLDVLGAEETVYGLKPKLDELGFTHAAWLEFDLLINVAFDMIGATLELDMLSFFVALVCGTAGSFDLSLDRDLVGESKGTTSEFIALDDDDGDV